MNLVLLIYLVLFQTTEETLERKYSRYGPVVSCSLHRHSESCERYGVVTMRLAYDAAKILYDCPIDVRPAIGEYQPEWMVEKRPRSLVSQKRADEDDLRSRKFSLRYSVALQETTMKIPEESNAASVVREVLKVSPEVPRIYFLANLNDDLAPASSVDSCHTEVLHRGSETIHLNQVRSLLWRRTQPASNYRRILIVLCGWNPHR